MATKKRLSLIYEIQNFADTYLEKVKEFQGNGFLRFGVLNHLLGWRWKIHPPPPSVLIGLRPLLSSSIMYTTKVAKWEGGFVFIIRKHGFCLISTSPIKCVLLVANEIFLQVLVNSSEGRQITHECFWWVKFRQRRAKCVSGNLTLAYQD